MSDLEKLQARRAELVEKKGSLNKRLANVKNELLSTLPRNDYTRLEGVRRQLVTSLQELDAELSALNAQKHQASVAESDARTPEEKNPWIAQIAALRDHYQEFAADGSRSPTMRRMASEFVVKLTPIIRKAIRREIEA